MSDEIPSGAGFLYVGACSDTCGHECCSTVAAEVQRLRAALAKAERERDEAKALSLQMALAAARGFQDQRDALRAALAEAERERDAALARGGTVGPAATICAVCGGDGTARCHAIIRMSSMAVVPDDRVLELRGRLYDAHKFISRLLGIGLNQAVREAERRVYNPLGRDEPWRGSQADWERVNIRILEGGLERLRENATELEAGKECRCAECVGTEVDLDAQPAAAAHTKSAASLGERVEQLEGALRTARYELQSHERTDTGHRDEGVLNALDEIEVALSPPPASASGSEQALCPCGHIDRIGDPPTEQAPHWLRPDGKWCAICRADEPCPDSPPPASGAKEGNERVDL